MNIGIHFKWMTTGLSIWDLKAHGVEIWLFLHDPNYIGNLNICLHWFHVILFSPTRTPFHADVFRSYSWSANICGRKKWLLYPPGQEDFLRDTHGNLPYDVTSTELQDRGLYPRSEEACQPLEIIQEAGEIIFVPSGWHHQVYNLVRILNA